MFSELTILVGRYVLDCTFFRPAGGVAPPSNSAVCVVVAPCHRAGKTHTRARPTAFSRLNDLVAEFFAVVERRPPKNDVIRKRLMASASTGGARPKFTVRDGDDYWLVKPTIESDVEDVAALEHATQTWGRKSGLCFAETRYLPHLTSRGIVLVKRFDRHKDRRLMCVSAASLLQVNHAPINDGDLTGASYPRLAETFKTIGVSLNDRKELFSRMVFNAVVGNDDDHARNHAITFHVQNKSWALAPAFDVVPNPTDESPQNLFMQVCAASTEILRDNLVKNHLQFGFDSEQQCCEHLNQLLATIRGSFEEVAGLFPVSFRHVMKNRMQHNFNKLRAGRT